MARKLKRVTDRQRLGWDSGLTDGCRINAVAVICDAILHSHEEEWTYRRTLQHLGMSNFYVDCHNLMLVQNLVLTLSEEEIAPEGGAK